MTESWFYHALLGLFLVVPGWMGTQFFFKEFCDKTGSFCYLVLLWSNSRCFSLDEKPGVDIWPQGIICLSIISIGLLFGSMGNLFLFRATSEAPNPGTVVAISGTAGIVVFLTSFGLGHLLPNFFDAINFNTIHFIGIFLVFLGIAIIGLWG